MFTTNGVKVARYSFSRPIPPKFEHKLRRHKQSFGKIANTAVLDKDEQHHLKFWKGNIILLKYYYYRLLFGH